MSDPAGESELTADRIGPAMWGEIYRSRRTGNYLRVIRNSTRGLTARRRFELYGWTDLPPVDGVAAVVKAGQERFFPGGPPDLVVEYAAIGVPLSGVLAGGSASDRVAAAAKVLRALPEWWASLGESLLPMAADVVLVDGRPALLRLPQWGVPGPAELLTEPLRTLHLAPELVRGESAGGGRETDLFASGAALLPCAFELGAGPGAAVLQRMAGGTALDAAHRTDRLPGWTSAVPEIPRAMEHLCRLVSPDRAERDGVDLGRLAEDLSRCAEALDPVVSVRRRRTEQDDEAALALAQEAMLDDASYDLYLIAAQIAFERLHRPLSALTFLDQAVRLDPARAEAYVVQFEIVALVHGVIIEVLSRVDAGIADRLDLIMSESYAHFDAEARDRWMPMMADYLTARGRAKAATRLLHPALFADGVELWWKFGHMLAYGRALLSAGRCEDARTVAGKVRTGLRRVQAGNTMSGEAIGRYGRQLIAFEDDIGHECGSGA